MLFRSAPLKHKETPHSAEDIKSRVMELAFNATFLREMRMFAHLREHVEQSWLPLGRFERRIARTNFHAIEAHELMSELTAETKLAVNLRFFEMLREMGRESAESWLQAHYAHIGKRSTIELSDLFY